jgi:hypothetical protein
MRSRFSIPLVVRIAFAEFVGTYVLVVSKNLIDILILLLKFDFNKLRNSRFEGHWQRKCSAGPTDSWSER